MTYVSAVPTLDKPLRAVLARRRLQQVRDAPTLLVLWVSSIILLSASLVVLGLLTTSLEASDVATWLVITGCGAVCVEATRRVGEPEGIAKDLLSAWLLPVALLLPPVYSLLIPVPLTVLTQLRVRRGKLHRRVYSAAAIGLANWVTSAAFHAYLSWRGTLSLDDTVGRTNLVLVATACSVLGIVLNVVLIAVAAGLASAEPGWRSLLGGRADRVTDAGEICLGVVVAACWLVTPALVLVMLAPVLLVQRSLTHEQLVAAARTDAKTGLLNAQAWQEEAAREVDRADRERQPLAVLLADLDHFKRINDAHGHQVGDVALKATVAALHGALRTYDRLGRFGGEEFTAVLPRTDQAEACQVAERLRRAVDDLTVVVDGQQLDLSVSVGVAMLGAHGQDLDQLIKAADHAMYQAKRSGRNQVAVAS